MRHLVLALLLASACLAAADPVVTADYACDETACQPPACQCARYSPPGGLTPDQIPQFVLLSHDNALDGLPYDLMMRFVGNKTQANGCPVPITWFAMYYHSNCEPAKQAIARGDEVAMQTNRFDPTDPFTATDPSPKYDSSDPVTGLPSVEREIAMSREHWNQNCGLPYYNMVGFRAPQYYNNPPIRKALAKLGYLYDSTLVERWYTNSPTSPSASQVLWPYTMDYGIPQECNFFGDTVGKCEKGEKYAGLWEVPLYQTQTGEAEDEIFGVGSLGDTDNNQPAIDDMEAFLKDQLDRHLSNGRTPMQLSTHYGWMSKKEKVDPTCDHAGCERPPSDNAFALSAFLDYAVKQPAVRFVTYSDFVRWMQDPVPLDQFDDWVQCKVPGVKADLSEVNLTPEQKAGAWYLKNAGAGGSTPAAPPAVLPEGAPDLADSPDVAPSPAVGPVEPAMPPMGDNGDLAAPPPTEVPPSAASTLSAAVAAAATLLAALALALGVAPS